MNRPFKNSRFRRRSKSPESRKAGRRVASAKLRNKQLDRDRCVVCSCEQVDNSSGGRIALIDNVIDGNLVSPRRTHRRRRPADVLPRLTPKRRTIIPVAGCRASANDYYNEVVAPTLFRLIDVFDG